MLLSLPPLPTMIVGSLPQPDWLIDRDRLGHQFPPRVRARELWRIPPECCRRHRTTPRWSPIRSQEEAGLDVLTDGEIRRESYSNHFATALDGRRPRQPRDGAEPVGHRHPGAAGDRRDPAAGPGPGRRRPVPAGAHRPRRSRSRFPGRSRWPSRRRTTTTPTTARWRWPTPTSSARRSPTCSPPAPTSCRSTSRGCRPARRSPAEYGAEAVTRAVDGRRRAGARAPLLRLRGDGRRAAGRLLVPAGARRRPGRHDLGGDGAVAPGPGDPAAAARARGSRWASSTSRRRRSRRRRRSPTGCGGRWTTSTSTGSCSPATAG